MLQISRRNLNIIKLWQRLIRFGMRTFRVPSGVVRLGTPTPRPLTDRSPKSTLELTPLFERADPLLINIIFRYNIQKLTYENAFKRSDGPEWAVKNLRKSTACCEACGPCARVGTRTWPASWSCGERCPGPRRRPLGAQQLHAAREVPVPSKSPLDATRGPRAGTIPNSTGASYWCRPANKQTHTYQVIKTY